MSAKSIAELLLEISAKVNRVYAAGIAKGQAAVAFNVDDFLSTESENPVQNKVITQAFYDALGQISESLESLAQMIEDLEGIEIDVDDELSDSSENPVKNKVITAVFNEAIANIEAQFAQVLDMIPAVDDGLDSESTNPVQNRVVVEAIGNIGNTAYSASAQAQAATDRVNGLSEGMSGFATRLTTVETAVGSFDVALDELHTYAQSLVNGGGSE